MMSLRSFTGPLWSVFAGNLLLLVCIIFYLVWWIVTFRPNSAGGGLMGAFSLLAAFVTGIIAIVLLSNGINLISQDSVRGLPIRLILLGAAAVFVVMLLVTSVGFHRMVTSELMIIHAWVALELSAAVVLYGAGHFGPGRTAVLAALLGVAFVVSMICYVLYYRLGEATSYRVGMVPLLMGAIVTAVFLGEMAVLK
jgi:hypothetical protein